MSYSKFLYMSLWRMHDSHVFFIVGSSNRTWYNSVFLCFQLWVSLCWCICWCRWFCFCLCFVYSIICLRFSPSISCWWGPSSTLFFHCFSLYCVFEMLFSSMALCFQLFVRFFYSFFFFDLIILILFILYFIVNVLLFYPSDGYFKHI